MLDTRTRRDIEWHFYNHEADKQLRTIKESDIIEANMCINSSYINSRHNHGSPTENKALKLLELRERRDWCDVVENTYIAFYGELEFDVMKALYIERKGYRGIIGNIISERAFWRIRDRWLEKAFMWAQEYELLGKRQFTDKNRQYRT